MDRKQQSRATATTTQKTNGTIDLTADDIPPLVTDTGAATQNAGFSDDEMQRAIAASLAHESALSGGGGVLRRWRCPTTLPGDHGEQ